MFVKIFQLTNNDLLSRSYEEFEEIKADDYKLVYAFETEDQDNVNDFLEDVFFVFNTNAPDNFHGHSLSVSDIVSISQGDLRQIYFCDKYGWKPIEGKWLFQEFNNIGK